MSDGVRPGEARVRVRYAETDQMGVVYHANYLVWFEVGRVELMRSLGFDYRTLEAEEGCLIAVVEATARYRQPARYDDELIVRAQNDRRCAAQWCSLAMRLCARRTVSLLCTGETTHVVVGRDLRKRSMPEQYVRGIPCRDVRAQRELSQRCAVASAVS